MHKVGSAVASVGVSLVASSVFAITGRESPVLNIENERDRQVVEVSRTTATVYEPRFFMSSSSRRIGTKQVGRQQNRSIGASVLMPDVFGSDLSSNPATWQPLNPDGLTSLMLDIKHAQDDGWTVTGVTRESTSSDEFRPDGTNAGLGRPNSQNEKFAEQYGNFAGDLFEDVAAKAGVDLSKANVAATSHEAVLDAGELAIFDSEARRLGFANASEFVRTYKANPEAMNTEAQQLMDTFITFQRQTDFAVQLSRTVPEEEGVYLTTETYRCLTAYRTDIETEMLPPVTDHIPVYPVLVPFPVRRRKRCSDKTPGAEVETSIPRTSPSWAKDVHQMRSERMNADQAGVEVELEATPKKVHIAIERSVGERTGPAQQSDWAERAARRDRIGKWVLGIAAGTIVAILSTARFEAVHCPETKDGGPEESSGSALYFNIPFTDIESERSLLFAPDCGEADSADENGNQGNSEPTCDIRRHVYQDGVLIRSEETHYPGAITIIEK